VVIQALQPWISSRVERPVYCATVKQERAVLADVYREIMGDIPKTELEKFEGYLRLLHSVDQNCRVKFVNRGTYLCFKDGSIWMLGRSETIEMVRVNQTGEGSV